ncbi:hypothetical protein N825_12690 [Skermanella stibiiresistens SB22]|uniref:Uncharacterized protein n=1 Tax=Skermanella stibiiresistens SB22 TaxID=1385369 RepID=W9H4J4_9PROT|nr:cupin domain-containing protein [Skermanella stibiiresistens]EWY38663.1 hypothetical protein N825_12690 [Skermanella stibiiresistens SB22]
MSGLYHQPPAHHPPEDILVSYAAGSLREPEALAVATHLAYCPACRRDSALLEEVGGVLLADLPPAPADTPAADGDGVLETLLSRIDEGSAEGATPAPVTANSLAEWGLEGLTIPEPLRSYIARTAVRTGWITLADGIEALRLDIAQPPAVAEILRMRPGSVLPTHRHPDQELILVIQGRFTEEASAWTGPGGRFSEGDLSEFDGGTIHTVVAGDDGCVCYRMLAQPVERLEAEA